MVPLFGLVSIALAVFISASLAHPKDDIGTTKLQNLHRRTASFGSQALGQCENTLAARLVNEASVRRRVETLENLRRAAGIQIEDPGLTSRSIDDLRKWENRQVVNHNKTGSVGNSDQAWAITKPQCALAPEDIVGPYYYPGELVRNDITEGQPGIPMWLEVELIHVHTCQPINLMMVDIWATNATGIYSHIPTWAGQGGIDTHYQRGAYRTNSDGIVWFKMIFPGHYYGRATHVHVMARESNEVKDNNGNSVVTGDEIQSSVHHIGQLYFDDTLRADVESNQPYTLNRQTLVTNDQDGFAKNQASADYDPFMNYVYVNSADVNDGLFVWISIGIDPSASKPQNPFPSGRPWKE